MSGITTHVLDTAKGKPATGVPIRLSRQVSHEWTTLGTAVTNVDGRAPDLVSANFKLEIGIYRLEFDTDAYFGSLGISGFYPSVIVNFYIANADQHHHVPLLLSPYGFSTYRGS